MIRQVQTYRFCRVHAYGLPRLKQLKKCVIVANVLRPNKFILTLSHLHTYVCVCVYMYEQKYREIV